MKIKEGINYVLINFTFFIFIIYLLQKLNILDDIIEFILLLFISLIFSYIIYPIYKRFKTPLSIFIIYFIILIIFLFIIYSVIPSNNFIASIIDFVNNIIYFIKNIDLKYNLNIISYVNNISNLVINNFVNAIKSTINYVSKFIFVIVLSICILLNIDNIKILIDKLKYKDLIYSINNKLNNYLIANVKILIIQFIEYTLLFKIIGHPNYLLLGLLNSINTFIPYIGSIFSIVIAVITSSIVSTKLLILSGIISIIFPNIDAYIITPKIYKNNVKVPPTMSISSIILFGSLFGFIGVVIAMPITIIIIEIFEYKSSKRKKSMI